MGLLPALPSRVGMAAFSYASFRTWAPRPGPVAGEQQTTRHEAPARAVPPRKAKRSD